jgi:ElaB/YqjD/DUF883 family membrane-anchored ribosome-binding protein
MTTKKSAEKTALQKKVELKRSAEKKVKELQSKAEKEALKAKLLAKKEFAKMKKELAAAEKKATDYVKKNPKKAAAISMGVGAAIGAAIVALSKARKK